MRVSKEQAEQPGYEYYAPSDHLFYPVGFKSEIWRHFKKNLKGQCRCNICGKVFTPTSHKYHNLYTHLDVAHHDQMGLSDNILAQHKIEEVPINDFLDETTHRSYPTTSFVSNLLRLFMCQEADFDETANRVVSNLRAERSRMCKFINEIPFLTDLHQARSQVDSEFPGLSAKTRESIFESHFWMFKEDCEILQHLLENGVTVRYRGEYENIYECLVLVTDSMKRAYHRYGDSMSIDFIPKICKKRTPKGFDQFSCWFFTGIDCKLNNVLFCFAMISQAFSENYEFLFELFLKEIGCKHPITICIPPLKQLQTMIREYFPKTNIIVNWYHKLKSLKEAIESERESKKIMKEVSQAMQTPSLQEYRDLYFWLQSKTADQRILTYGLQKNSQLHCIHRIPKAFIGFNIEPNKYVQLENQVRKTIVYQQNFARVFVYVLRLEQTLNRVFIPGRDSGPSQPQAKNDGQQSRDALESMRDVISGELYARLQRSWEKEGELSVTDDKVCPVTLKKVRERDGKRKKTYWVEYKVEGAHWLCNCGFLELTGLPCKHLAEVVKIHEGDLCYYLNSRWRK